MKLIIFQILIYKDYVLHGSIFTHYIHHTSHMKLQASFEFA